MNITAALLEHNGDRSVVASLSLTHEGEEIDSVSSVELAPASSAEVVFSATFDQPGTYHLKAVVNEALPALYQDMMSTAEIVIEVLENVTSVSYYMYYNYTHQDYDYTWSSSYDSGHYMYKGDTQYLNYQIRLDSINEALEFPLASVSISFVADNQAPVFSMELNDLAADNTWDYGYSRGQSLWKDLGNRVYFYAYTYEYNGGYNYSYASIDQHASDYVYFSEGHNYYWGDYSNSSEVKEGSFILAEQSVQARLVVQSNDGSSYGGSAEISQLERNDWDNSMDYSYGDYQRTGYNRGFQVYGNSSGMSQP